MTFTELAKALDKEEMDKQIWLCEEMDDEAFLNKFGCESDT